MWRHCPLVGSIWLYTSITGGVLTCMPVLMAWPGTDHDVNVALQVANINPQKASHPLC